MLLRIKKHNRFSINPNFFINSQLLQQAWKLNMTVATTQLLCETFPLLRGKPF